MGSTNHVSDGIEIAPRKGAIFGVVRSIEKHWKFLLLHCVLQKGPFSRQLRHAAYRTIQSSITARHAMQLSVIIPGPLVMMLSDSVSNYQQ